ncbi:MAG TPA: hypothetical protein VGA03_00895, partial [Anaerolineales bacterium]
MRTILFLSLVALLAACALPTPTAQPQAPAATNTAPAPVNRTETPPKPTIEPSATPEKRTVTKTDQAPFLLLAEWNAGGKKNTIYPVDPASGEALPAYAPLTLGKNGFSHVFSQDGNRLAVVAFHGQSCDSISGGTRCRGGEGELHLLDVPAWQVVSAALPVDGYVEMLAFSPDADRLALAASARDEFDLVVFDGYSGESLAQRSLDFPPEM